MCLLITLAKGVMDPINCWESSKHKVPLIYSLDCWKLSHLRLCLLPWVLCVQCLVDLGYKFLTFFHSSGQYLRVSFKTPPGVSSGFCWYFIIAIFPLRLPRWFSGKEPACQCRRHKRCGFNPWVRKMPWSRRWQPTPVSLPGGLQSTGSQRAGQDWATEHTHTHTLTHTHTHTYTHTHLIPLLSNLFFLFLPSHIDPKRTL